MANKNDNILLPYGRQVAQGTDTNAYTASDPDGIGTGLIQLSDSDVPCRAVWIAANSANDGSGNNATKVNVGIITAGAGNAQGITLRPSDTDGIIIPVSNVNLLCLKAYTSGDSVDWVAFD